VVAAEDHVLSVRLSHDLYEQLRRLAFDRHASQADIIRAALQQYLREEREQS
jgi:predicted transcriptional regulator